VSETEVHYTGRIVQIKLQKIVFESVLCDLFMIDDVSALFDLKHERQMSKDIKDCFACVQHEMKNCVTFILTFTDLLLLDCSEYQLKFLEPLKEAARLLMFTMSDWLDNTKMENSAFLPSLSTFKIVEAIQEITRMCHTMLGSKNVELRCIGLENMALVLRTDRQRFQQVLLNLITNATKYAPKDSHIDCCFKFDRPKQRLFVEVWD